MVYSTYLGGNGDDYSGDIVVDSAGSAYVTGYTSSTDFPTTSGAFQTACAGARYNFCNFPAFVTKLNAAGSGLVYSTYLGGSGQDFVSGIAVDSAGSAWVTGNNNSTDFPTTTGALRTAYGGGFLTKLNADGSGLVYSTYLDGIGNSIAVDSGGSVYLTGTTGSTNFPTTPGAFQTANAGGSDAFVTKIGDSAQNVNGNLTISNGQSYTFVNGQITGNVTMTGGTLVLDNTAIGGNLQMSGGNLSMSSGSSVGSDLQISGGGTFSIGPQVTIGGNLTIQSLPAIAGTTNQVCGASVKGSLVLQNSGTAVQIGSSGCAGNIVGGNLQVHNNTAATTIDNNTVGGNLTDQNNTGATQVFSNSITHSLQCGGNTAITGGGNTAGSKQGQCLSF
jgi:hypothetical protein